MICTTNKSYFIYFHIFIQFQIISIFINFEKFYKKLTIPCFHDNSKFQLKFISNYTLESECEKMNFDKEKVETLRKFYNEKTLTYNEILSALSKKHLWINEVNEKWNGCIISTMSLTGVGIAIAQANIKRKLGHNIDLTIWSKE